MNFSLNSEGNPSSMKVYGIQHKILLILLATIGATNMRSPSPGPAAIPTMLMESVL